MGFSIFETNKLTLIPAYLPRLYDIYGYHAYSGGVFAEDSELITGGYYYAGTVGNWIEFAFKGSILGILFGYKSGKIDLIVDGNTIAENFDVSTINGPEKNAFYIFTQNLTEDNHLARIVLNQGSMRIVGALVDSRVNFFDLSLFPGTDWKDEIVCWNASLPAGATVGPVIIKRAKQLLIYVKVSAATTITLQVKTGDGYIDYDSLNFTGAGYNFWNIWSLASDRIKFKTSNAATVSIEVMMKS
jgi:hypothetical protein